MEVIEVKIVQPKPVTPPPFHVDILGVPYDVAEAVMAVLGWCHVSSPTHQFHQALANAGLSGSLHYKVIIKERLITVERRPR